MPLPALSERLNYEKQESMTEDCVGNKDLYKSDLERKFSLLAIEQRREVALHKKFVTIVCHLVGFTAFVTCVDG